MGENQGFSLLKVVLILALIAVGCGPGVGTTNTQNSITVGAAADLQFAFREIGDLYQQDTGEKVVFSFGSSGTLAQQIENGAPIDVFASADVGFVDRLGAAGLIIGGTQQLYAVGRIVLATNRQSGVAVRNLGDLLQPSVKRIAIANPDHAPYGVAAKQALESVGIWEQITPKLVYGENIAQAMQYVQTGNVEAGIIALSVANVPDIEYVLIDDSLHSPLKQALAVIASTKQESASREFIDFVNGPKGRPVMKKYGFLLPGEF